MGFGLEEHRARACLGRGPQDLRESRGSDSSPALTNVKLVENAVPSSRLQRSAPRNDGVPARGVHRVRAEDEPDLPVRVVRRERLQSSEHALALERVPGQEREVAERT